jgi:hypothetical protein
VQGVKEGTFETFDPVGVADMLHQLGGAAHSIVARAIEGRSAAEREKAISMLDQRIKLYGIALDRILGLPDKSVRLVKPGLVRAVMTARRRLSPARGSPQSSSANEAKQ